MPEPPANVRVACQPRSALISWRSPLAHTSPIYEYRIELQTSFDERDAWRTALVERNIEQRNDFEAQIDLPAWVNAKLRVIAVNSYGESVPGYDESAQCETAPSPPASNPKNVVVAGTKPDNLVIRWEPMEKR